MLQPSLGRDDYAGRVNVNPDEDALVGSMIPAEFEDLYDQVENPDFDAVHHADRPKTVVSKELHAYLSAHRPDGPVTAPRTDDCTYIFPGDFVLASPPSGVSNDFDAVLLYRVTKVLSGSSFRSAELTFTACAYEHTPNPQVAGLFGTFAVMTVDGAEDVVGPRRNHQRKTVRHTLDRSLVKVYNCNRNRSQNLSLASLHSLAMKLPNEYGLPDRIPDSHKSEKNVLPARSRRRSGKDRAEDAEAQCEGSDGEEEEDDEDDSSGSEGDEFEPICLSEDVFVDCRGSSDLQGSKYPVGLMRVVAVNADEQKFKGKWYIQDWTSFEPPSNWIFRRAVSDDQIWKDDPNWIDFDSAIRGVQLKWNAPPRFGYVKLSSRSSGVLAAHLQSLSPPLVNKED